MNLRNTLSIALLVGLCHAIPSYASDPSANVLQGADNQVAYDDHHGGHFDNHGGFFDNHHGGGERYGRGNPFRFRHGDGFHWAHWNHGGGNFWLADGIFLGWSLGHVRAITCTAQDNGGAEYSVSEEEDFGFWSVDNVHGLEDRALDQCYANTGGDPSCHIADCTRW
jgi:hypothetical protein